MATRIDEVQSYDADPDTVFAMLADEEFIVHKSTQSGSLDVTAEVVLPGSDSTACSGVDAEVEDTIVLIDRGDCYFADKVLAAQTAGAVGVITVRGPRSFVDAEGRAKDTLPDLASMSPTTLEPGPRGRGAERAPARSSMAAPSSSSSAVVIPGSTAASMASRTAATTAPVRRIPSTSR